MNKDLKNLYFNPQSQQQLIINQSFENSHSKIIQNKQKIKKHNDKK